MTNKILFACLGNICRSPLAEGIVRLKAQNAGLELELDSAGTGGWHVGDPADARAVVAARLKGYNIENQISRKIGAGDFDAFDLIVAMDETNRQDIEALRPSGSTVPVVLMSSFAREQVSVEVPDPYYTGKFEPVIAMLETCADALVSQLLAARQ
ncbi:protein-tyrosine phosphatase [Litoreibacter ascidiaceicola]|uniref:protein-tyrosine-phosphatase n=1 Tax=Litoreibacter ascidiaceicola TaxID=1486859 RepID=A0A1M4YIF7_9RHOB|nr:low molecular weight protein-tyrosine-phosphatase [Litoreibacter ascidiaceicola]SHF05654.1 protein-tyrosine phosphatase [Litoreibacter ascidiaceicola]